LAVALVVQGFTLEFCLRFRCVRASMGFYVVGMLPIVEKVVIATMLCGSMVGWIYGGVDLRWIYKRDVALKATSINVR